MAVEATMIDGLLIVNLQGEMDHHTVEQMRVDIERELESIAYRGLILSFAGTDFMDSSGLGLILGRYRSVTQHGGTLAICDVSPTLMKLFELSGILKIIPVYTSVDAAIRAVKGA